MYIWYLVRSADEIEIMTRQESADDVGAERKRNTAVVVAPAVDFLIGIRPEEITEETRVRHVCRTHDPADLVHRVQVGRQAAMHTQDLLVNHSRNGQAVEAVCECLPDLDIVPPLACIQGEKTHIIFFPRKILRCPPQFRYLRRKKKGEKPQGYFYKPIKEKDDDRGEEKKTIP